MKTILPAVVLVTLFSGEAIARCGCETAPCEEETVASAVQRAVEPAAQPAMEISLMAIDPPPEPLAPMFWCAIIATVAAIASHRFARRTDRMLLERIHCLFGRIQGAERALH